MKEPSVGIFWLINDRLLFDSTPIRKAETDIHFKIHSGDHYSVWEALQRIGRAPAEIEYEELPRGRVMFDMKTQKFTILADRCILKRADLVGKIRVELNLPKDTNVGTDSHYRCFDCLNDESE